MSENWYIYIIRCKNNTLYTGITKDVSRRFKEHQEQSRKCAKYLKGKLPLKLVYSEQLNSREEALSIEKTIKKFTKREKEELIVNNQLKLKIIEE